MLANSKLSPKSRVWKGLRRIVVSQCPNNNNNNNNNWRFGAGQRLGYFPPIRPVYVVYFHIHPYIQFHISSIIVSLITPGGGGGPHDQAATGLEPATTH